MSKAPKYLSDVVAGMVEKVNDMRGHLVQMQRMAMHIEEISALLDDEIVLVDVKVRTKRMRANGSVTISLHPLFQKKLVEEVLRLEKEAFDVIHEKMRAKKEEI